MSTTHSSNSGTGSSSTPGGRGGRDARGAAAVATPGASGSAAAPAVAQGTLSRKEVISYSLGDVANNLSFLMTSTFLMVYLTEIAGISAAIAGALYGITKIWAGFSDLIAGQVVDRADTRWGRLRPWILWCSTPLAIVFVLLFSVPAGLSGATTVAWVLLFDALFQLGYSFVNIPYGSLSAAMTQDPVDRSKLSGARSIAGAITGVVLAFFVSPQFQDTSSDNIRLKFTLTCLALGAVAVVLYLICFFNSHENVPRGQGKISFKNTFSMVAHNKPLLVLCNATFFLLCAMFTMNAVAMYYTINVLGNASWFAYLQIAQTLGTILMASFVPAISARMGKRNGYIIGSIIVSVGYALAYFIPSGVLTTGLIAWFIIGMGVGTSNTLIFSMQADTVDYGEWKTGVRAEGGAYSILSLIRKLGQGVGGWVGGAIIGAFGYVSGAEVQTDNALHGIRVAMGIVPAAFALVALAVILAYRLNADTHAKIIDELHDRRTETAVAEAKGVDVETVRNLPNVGDGRSMLLRNFNDVHPPIVTIFGQRGSGASEIAPALAEALAVPYIDQRFTSATLAQAKDSELVTDTTLSRFLRSLSGSTDDSAFDMAASQSANRELAKQNTDYVLNAVSDGGILLGRNGALILGPVYGAMHIRLVAPLDKRIERVMYKTGLDAKAAEQQCHAEDRLRAEMSRRVYKWDPNKDEDYDLVINTASVTYAQVVEIIAATYRSKYPQMAATKSQAIEVEAGVDAGAGAGAGK